MVTTAAVRTGLGSAIEKNVFLFVLFTGNCARCRGCHRRGSTLGRCGFRFGAAVTRGLVQQAQPFHQQSLCIELGGLLVGLAFEIELEVSTGPAQYLENGFVADERSIRRM